MTLTDTTECDTCKVVVNEYIPYDWLRCIFYIRITSRETEETRVDFCSYECLTKYIESHFADTMTPRSILK